MTFRAQFPGDCVDCDVPIRIGDAIVRVDGAGGYRHLVCPDDPDLTTGAPCTRCHLIHNGECF